MTRVFFCNSRTRQSFFKELLESEDLEQWKELSSVTGIPESTLGKYRRGKHSIPSKRFHDMLNLLDSKQRTHYLNNVKQKEDNWGVRKGGIATYSNHPEIFEKGREKASKLKKAKYDFDIHMKLSEELCEFIGAFIGDGFTNKYGSSYMTQFTGHSKLDKAYYQNTITPIISELFNTPSYTTYDGNTMRVNIYSKRLFEMLTQRFKLERGKKVYTTKIPREIADTKKDLLFSTIRGIFDADGCLFLDEREVYKNPYPRITFQTASDPLYQQLKNILGKHFNLYTSKRKNKRHYIEIYGHEQLKKWNELIGFSNKRHDASVA